MPFSTGFNIPAQSAGVSDNATKAEIKTDTAIVKANCSYKTPTIPPKNATGTKTADNTKATPITGFCTFFIAANVASLADKWLCLISYSTASITTMASSMTNPIANTIANKVNVLIVNPKTAKEINVPKRDTGTAIMGINVERQFCRNRNTIMATMHNASIKVFLTSFKEA